MLAQIRPAKRGVCSFMSLRRKTLLILLAVFVSLNLILYATSQTVLLESFAELETQIVRQNVERARTTLDEELADLSASAGDYARWDDTYAFIADRNPEYIEANLQSDFFVNLGLNLMAFVNTDGEIVFIRAVDLQSGVERDLPPGVEAHLQAGSPLLNHADVNSSQKGVILLTEGPLLVAARPITDDFAREPIRGTLIFGEFLNSAKITEFSQSLGLPIIPHSTNEASLPQDFQAAQAALTGGTTTFVNPLSNEQIAGYIQVNDIYGSPALLLRVDMPRDVTARGQSSIALFLGLLVVTGLVFGALTLLLLERLVLSRLTHLSADVNRISTGGTLAGRVAVAGDDELSRLAVDMNAMLETLDKAQTRQRDSDLQLRSIVTGAPLMLWAAEVDGKLTLLEGKSLEMLGINPAASLGRPVAEVFRNIPQLVSEIYRALKGEEFSTIVVVKDYTFDTRYVPARGLDGAITGMIGVATNITERVMAEEALTEAYEDLSRQNQQLERVQELLRTTLDQVSDTVRRGADKAEIVQYIEFVQSEFDRLD